jgi:hypothetical protein
LDPFEIASPLDFHVAALNVLDNRLGISCRCHAQSRAVPSVPFC